MTVIGLDDTDSRTEGMCTTYVAASLAAAIEDAGGQVPRTLLVRLNPAVEYKTRGNAALAVHCTLPAEEAFDLAEEAIGMAATGDPKTNPGVVVADHDVDPGAGSSPMTPAPAADVRTDLADFATNALHRHLSPGDARSLLAEGGYRTHTEGSGRGLVGALAAVGAWWAFEDWTYECISYRDKARWGTERDVETASVFAAAEAHYPTVWDTVDTVEERAICVPRTPCPILHGIRGETRDGVEAVARAIAGEPVPRRHTFVTNQGTDAHLTSGSLGALANDRAYRVSGEVTKPPWTIAGGHTFVRIRNGDATLECVAFEPTKRFREHVRALRTGDSITACGEVSDGTLKLEKFALRDRIETESVTPTCPECGRSMASAGATQGYRCRDCTTAAPGQVERSLDRSLEPGWYEVPPCARRHIAKPLVRGGFDAPTHPAR